MKNHNYLFCRFGVFLALVLSGCALYGKSSAPYIVKGEMILESENPDMEQNFEIGGLKVYFFNKENKPVSEFTIVFTLFDQDGEPINIGRSTIVATVKKTIDPLTSFNCCLSLDQDLGEVPEEPYVVDYLYVSRIVYEDGTQWNDAFGLSVM